MKIEISMGYLLIFAALILGAFSYAAINDRGPVVIRTPLGSMPPSLEPSNYQHSIMLVRTFVDNVEFNKHEVQSFTEGKLTTNIWTRSEQRTNYVLGYYNQRQLVEIGVVDSLSLKR